MQEKWETQENLGFFIKKKDVRGMFSLEKKKSGAL